MSKNANVSSAPPYRNDYNLKMLESIKPMAINCSVIILNIKTGSILFITFSPS